MDTQKIYHEMGISSAVLAFCCSAEEELKPRFAAIDARGIQPGQGRGRHAEKPCQRGVLCGLHRLWL